MRCVAFFIKLHFSKSDLFFITYGLHTLHNVARNTKTIVEKPILFSDMIITIYRRKVNTHKNNSFKSHNLISRVYSKSHRVKMRWLNTFFIMQAAFQLPRSSRKAQARSLPLQDPHLTGTRGQFLCYCHEDRFRKDRLHPRL